MAFGTKIFTTAFVTGQSELHTADIDLREESLVIRGGLKGKLIPVKIYGQHIYDIAEPLLKVTSTHAADFVKKGTVSLPDPAFSNMINSHTVGIVLNYMTSLTKTEKASPLQLRGDDADMITQLGVCQAANSLGMEKYVEHIIRRVYAIFHGLPSYEGLNTLIIHKDSYPRVYAIAVRNFARRIREGEIPDNKDFDEYPKTRPDFAHDVEDANNKHENWEQSQAKYEQRQQQRVKIEEQTKAQAVELQKQEKEHLVRDKQFWDAKKANDTKMRKFTPRSVLDTPRSRASSLLKDARRSCRLARR